MRSSNKIFNIHASVEHMAQGLPRCLRVGMKRACRRSLRPLCLRIFEFSEARNRELKGHRSCISMSKFSLIHLLLHGAREANGFFGRIPDFARVFVPGLKEGHF